MFSPRETPATFTQKLQAALGPRLISVVLYGSAAKGQHIPGQSDYNLMVAVEHWGILELNLIAKVTDRWIQQGNPPPLLFTVGRLQSSADCFPIEMLDMKQAYQVLYGVDVLQEVTVQPVHLRLIVEREIKSLNIQLRQGFIMVRGQPARVAALLVNHLSTMVVLLRAALRLHSGAIPTGKYEVFSAIAQHVSGFQADAFETLRQLKAGQLRPQRVNALQLFDRVMESLGLVVQSVDRQARSH